MRLRCWGGFGVLLLASGMAWAAPGSSTLDGSIWSTLHEPAPGLPAAIGGFSAGCLQGARPLALDGPGYQVMRPSRGRTFGHPALIQFLEGLGRKASTDEVGVVLVGDLGLPRGGWMKSGHASHQSGLDVDLWFSAPRVAFRRKLSRRERESTSAESLVRRKFERGVKKKLWTKRVRHLLKLVATDPSVDRVFVNAAIKAELCREEDQAAWLQKIRPWYGHDEHLHARLRCPVDSPLCRSQEPLPAGSGCDPTLDWWFSEDARAEARKMAEKAKIPTPPPAIPEGCLPLVPQVISLQGARS